MAKNLTDTTCNKNLRGKQNTARYIGLQNLGGKRLKQPIKINIFHQKSTYFRNVALKVLKRGGHRTPYVSTWLHQHVNEQNQFIQTKFVNCLADWEFGYKVQIGKFWYKFVTSFICAFLIHISVLY